MESKLNEAVRKCILLESMGAGIITGSVAFGTAEKLSDCDFVFSLDHCEAVDNLITSLEESGKERTNSNYHSGFKFTLSDGSVINFIPTSPWEFPEWVFTTIAMKAVWKKLNKFHSDLGRKDKIALFKSMKANFSFLTTKGLGKHRLNSKQLIDLVTGNEEITESRTLWE